MKKVMIKASFLFVTLMMFFIVASCGCGANDEDEFAIEGQTADGFEDGAYCADVTYYNPNTGMSNDYTLEVEVVGSEVVQINFGNGGWLDSDHMSPETLDENGECTITSDRNYEYSITITGRNCGNSDSVNPETDEDLPRYTFMECASILQLTDEEIANCLEIYSKDQLLSENGLKGLEQYIENIREIHANYEREVSGIRREQNAMQNEINEGYVMKIDKRTAYGVKTQTIYIKKRGVTYTLEVRGSDDCTMGTARFDENNYNWQLVYIKESPNIEEYSGHYMRIIR